MTRSFHYLSMANHALFSKYVFTMLERAGLTPGQPKVLDYLGEHNGSSQKDIARGCHIEAATLTSLLGRMEEKGLIMRKMQDGNRRSLYVYLTQTGWAQQAAVARTFAQAEQEAMKGISPQEQEQILNTMEHIYQNLMAEEVL